MKSHLPKSSAEIVGVRIRLGWLGNPVLEVGRREITHTFNTDHPEQPTDAILWRVAARRDAAELAAFLKGERPSPTSGHDAVEVSALGKQVGGDHYRAGSIQPVQYVEANGLGFLEGCVLKRITRHSRTTGKGRQDIEKAIHELQLLLQFRYGGGA